MEAAIDAARRQAAISAFQPIPMLCVGFPSPHTAGYPTLCSALHHPRQHHMVLPLLEGAHIRKGKSVQAGQQGVGCHSTQTTK